MAEDDYTIRSSSLQANNAPYSSAAVGGGKCELLLVEKS